MEAGLDTGPILAMERLPIAAASTAASCTTRWPSSPRAWSVRPSTSWRAGGPRRARSRRTASPTPPKLDKAEARLDWTRPAAVLERQLRALNPWPGCWTEVDGERLLVLEASSRPAAARPGEVLDDRLTVACGEGALRLTRVQRAGGRPMSAEEFLRGFPLPVGARLGTPCPATS